MADLLVPCVMFLFVAQLAILSTLYMSSVFGPGSDVVKPAAHELPRQRYRSVAAGGARRERPGATCAH